MFISAFFKMKMFGYCFLCLLILVSCEKKKTNQPANQIPQYCIKVLDKDTKAAVADVRVVLWKRVPSYGSFFPSSITTYSGTTNNEGAFCSDFQYVYVNAGKTGYISEALQTSASTLELQPIKYLKVHLKHTVPASGTPNDYLYIGSVSKRNENGIPYDYDVDAWWHYGNIDSVLNFKVDPRVGFIKWEFRAAVGSTSLNTVYYNTVGAAPYDIKIEY